MATLNREPNEFKLTDDKELPATVRQIDRPCRRRPWSSTPPAAGCRALPNTFLLPHLGSATVEIRTAMTERCLDNLDAVFAGREPPDRLV